MASMAVKVSPMGSLGGMELHPSASVKASAHRPYNVQIRQQSLSVSGHYLAQEAPMSRTLVVSNPSQKRGKAVGSNRPDRRSRACKSSSVSCRCLGSGEFGKGDGDNEVRKNRDKTGENAGTSGGEGQPRQKKKQATAVKMGAPFREMMLTAGRRLQDYLESYKRSKMEARVEDSAESDKTSDEENAWEQLQKVFAEVDERQNLVRQLTFQMDEAIGIEDFKEAGRLKKALASAMAEDLVANVMIELTKALEEEQYDAAAQIRDKAGAGLPIDYEIGLPARIGVFSSPFKVRWQVGWWAGVSESGSDPYGRIINISPVEGRFIAKGYSARQLALAAAGVPLFEVFLTKDGDSQYQQHAVYLQRDGNGTADSIVGFSKDVLDFENMLGAASKDMKLELDILEENSDEGDEKQMDLEAMEEGMNKILNFLKDRMPDVKMKVFQVIANGKMEADLPKIVEQLMEDAEDELLRQEELADVGSSGSSGSNFEIIKSIDEIPPAGNSTLDNASENDVGMSMGDIFSNPVYDLPSRVPNRVPARIEHKDQNTFLFEIQDLPGVVSSAPPQEVHSVKVVSIATKPAAGDVEEVLRSVGQLLVEEGDAVELENSSKDITGILQSAVIQAQQRRGLLKETLFHRIDLSGTGNDPFSGLYIGSLGPHTAEVVQLQRKYGDWQTDGVNPNGQELQFFEYVEAVKLTGDVNVPAGQVTFRAKVGKDSRLPHRGVYPEELGVIARYKGQARMAEPGFKDPRWVDGELVLLNGKGGPTNGAELGFVYLGPGSHFLVLFGKLRLKN